MKPSTQLYRQIRNCHIQNGYVCSLAFCPMPKDQKKLSVYDGDKISPDAALIHFTENLKCHSEGIMAVIVQECHNEELNVEEDYETHQYHMLIDFTGKSKSATKKTAEHLRNFAVKRGWLCRKKT